jgi:hypothetical protein
LWHAAQGLARFDLVRPTGDAHPVQAVLPLICKEHARDGRLGRCPGTGLPLNQTARISIEDIVPEPAESLNCTVLRKVIGKRTSEGLRNQTASSLRDSKTLHLLSRMSSK